MEVEILRMYSDLNKPAMDETIAFTVRVPISKLPNRLVDLDFIDSDNFHQELSKLLKEGFLAYYERIREYQKSLGYELLEIPSDYAK